MAGGPAGQTLLASRHPERWFYMIQKYPEKFNKFKRDGFQLCELCQLCITS
jgi:hypothetical protein